MDDSLAFGLIALGFTVVIISMVIEYFCEDENEDIKRITEYMHERND